MKQQPFYAFEYEGESHDCGDKLGWLKANVALGLKDKELAAAFGEYLRGKV